MLRQITLYFAPLLILTLSLAGCQTTREVLDLETSAEITFSVSNQVNPDEDGRASPLNVTVVLLRDDRQFDQEEFIELYQDTKARLSGDYISQVTLKEFLPGEKRKEIIDLNPEVKYLGIIAAFSQYKKANTKIALPITAHKTNEYALRIDELSVRLQ